MSAGRNRTKQLNRKAHALRIKEKRLKRQSAFMMQGEKVLDIVRGQGFEAGRQQGFIEGLEAALELGHEQKRHASFMHYLREKIKELKHG